jgi:hypothetical protein
LTDLPFLLVLRQNPPGGMEARRAPWFAHVFCPANQEIAALPGDGRRVSRHKKHKAVNFGTFFKVGRRKNRRMGQSDSGSRFFR